MALNLRDPRRPLPFYEGDVSAGFPSPADDFLERPLDLHELLIHHPAATFFIRVRGDSMQGAGIFSGDILIVDRSLSIRNHQIIIAFLNGEFTVKRLFIEGEKVSLLAHHLDYPPIEVSSEADFQIWGVVTYVIHRAS